MMKSTDTTTALLEQFMQTRKEVANIVSSLDARIGVQKEKETRLKTLLSKITSQRITLEFKRTDHITVLNSNAGALIESALIQYITPLNNEVRQVYKLVSQASSKEKTTFNSKHFQEMLAMRERYAAHVHKDKVLEAFSFMPENIQEMLAPGLAKIEERCYGLMVLDFASEIRSNSFCNDLSSSQVTSLESKRKLSYYYTLTGLDFGLSGLFDYRQDLNSWDRISSFCSDSLRESERRMLSAVNAYFR